jgi:hypothetical protein
VQLFLLEKLHEYSFSGWQQLEKCSGRSAGLNAPGSLPDFRYAALDTTACAAFIKESRMNCQRQQTPQEIRAWRRLASVPDVVRMPSKYCKCPVELFGQHQAR